MSQMNPNQIEEVRDSLLNTIKELTDLLREKRTQLSKEEKEEINKAADELSSTVDKLNVQAIHGTALQIQESIQGIRTAANNANNALKTLGNVRKTMNIATSLIGLGTAIATGNLQGIMTAATGVSTTVNQALNS